MVYQSSAAEADLFDIEVATVDAMRMRAAGKGPLSLALMDARNNTLRWVSAFEKGLAGERRLSADDSGRAPAAPERRKPAAADADELTLPPHLRRTPGIDPLRWTLGHVGWYQEFWIGRNVQRQRGEHCDPSQAKLASILPGADRCFDPNNAGADARWLFELPDLQTLRQYLVDTLETTLELLASASEDDDSLYFYRLALFREDQVAETLAALSQEVGFDAGLLPSLATVAPRQPISLPATRWTLGMAPGGFVFDNEKWSHEVEIPGFEIDAQAVSWAQYCEFVEDGGYDDAAHWSADGWAWVQAQGRRTPRHVDQMRQGVLQRRFGKLARVPMNQPAVHLSWYEADAWCRWAGRRLPTEVEWEAAAHQAATRGMRWGDVWEWTASTFRPYPGFQTGPDAAYSVPAFGTHKVLRGASFATRGRLKTAKFRQFALPQTDTGFMGLRSCAFDTD